MAYTPETNKIDNEAVDGLSGVNNSLAYKVHEIEKHFHNYERWFGPAAAPDGDNAAALLGDQAGEVLTSFQVTSGASSTFGTALQVWGATDESMLPAQVKFDVHHIRFTDVQTDKQEWIIRLIQGTSAAQGVIDGTYSDRPFFIEKTDKNTATSAIMMGRSSAGDKLWLQALQYTTADARTLDFQIGVHGYAG